MDTEELIAKGYRRVSNKHATVSRIDRSDWIDFLYDQVFIHRATEMKDALKDFYDGKDISGFREGTIRLEAGSAADHYRRCFSKDTLNLDYADAQKIPNSNHDTTGYVKIT